LVKNLIILFIVTLTFSTVTLAFPNLMKGVFGDIFKYASPDMQNQVVSKLTESCSSLDQGKNFVTINQFCANRSLIDSMRANCEEYKALKQRNIKIENEEQVTKTCEQFESGGIERKCDEISQTSSLSPDFSKIGGLCKDYKAGKINSQEFFFNTVGSTLPSNLELPQTDFLHKYNNLINYLNNNKILYFLILAILLVILYLLITDIKLFLIALSGISFSIGTLILLPYLAILVYDKFVGIDTSPILGSMLGTGSVFNFKAIVSVILLLFLRTYTSFIITLGIIFLSVGIVGKVYEFLIKRVKFYCKKQKKKMN